MGANLKLKSKLHLLLQNTTQKARIKQLTSFSNQLLPFPTRRHAPHRKVQFSSRLKKRRLRKLKKLSLTLSRHLPLKMLNLYKKMRKCTETMKQKLSNPYNSKKILEFQTMFTQHKLNLLK